MKNKSIIILASLLLATPLFLWSGIYNIAANDKHWAVTNAIIEILRERSIEVRADDIIAPDDLDQPSRIAAGAVNYAEMCEQCHLAPGGEKTELHIGLYPLPPIFYQQDGGHEEHGIQNNFWVIKNGIKLTGMPAWGASHTDDEIWSLVAFIEQLYELSSEQYEKLVTTKQNEH